MHYKSPLLYPQYFYETLPSLTINSLHYFHYQELENYNYLNNPY